MSAMNVLALMEPDLSAHRLALGEALTVRNIRDVHARVAGAIHQHRCIWIDCSNATEVDLSFIQLILAARKSATAANKIVSLAHPASGVLLDRLMQAGLVGGSNGQPAADEAFWLNLEAANGQDHSHSG